MSTPSQFGLEALIYRPFRPGSVRMGGLFAELDAVTIIGLTGPGSGTSHRPAEDDPELRLASALAPAVYLHTDGRGTVWAVPALRPGRIWLDGGTFAYCPHPWFLGIVGQDAAVHLRDRSPE